jgi:mono/diheme cytochrome c family protein
MIVDLACVFHDEMPGIGRRIDVFDRALRHWRCGPPRGLVLPPSAHVASVSLGWCWATLAAIASTVLPTQAAPPPAQCPQPRFTGKAPEDYYSRANPLQPDAGNLSAGEELYLGKAGGSGCAICHGDRGEGNGPLATQFSPPPRNFACAKTVNDIPDGQLFWIVRFGSPGTSMPSHQKLTDEQIWQVVLHLRRLAK